MISIGGRWFGDGHRWWPCIISCAASIPPLSFLPILVLILWGGVDVDVGIGCIDGCCCWVGQAIAGRTVTIASIERGPFATAPVRSASPVRRPTGTSFLFCLLLLVSSVSVAKPMQYVHSRNNVHNPVGRGKQAYDMQRGTAKKRWRSVNAAHSFIHHCTHLRTRTSCIRVPGRLLPRISNATHRRTDGVT